MDEKEENIEFNTDAELVAAQRGPTHAEVASLLNMSVAGVSHLRLGRRKPSRGRIYQISVLFGWSTDDQYDCLNDGSWAVCFENILQSSGHFV